MGLNSISALPTPWRDVALKKTGMRSVEYNPHSDLAIRSNALRGRIICTPLLIFQRSAWYDGVRVLLRRTSSTSNGKRGL